MRSFVYHGGRAETGTTLSASMPTAASSCLALPCEKTEKRQCMSVLGAKSGEAAGGMKEGCAKAPSGGRPRLGRPRPRRSFAFLPRLDSRLPAPAGYFSFCSHYCSTHQQHLVAAAVVCVASALLPLPDGGGRRKNDYWGRIWLRPPDEDTIVLTFEELDLPTSYSITKWPRLAFLRTPLNQMVLL